jgi:UDP-N-acetylmuramate dehydrogenase
MLARIAGDVRFKEPLSFHTSLRIGGPAEFFIVPRDVDDVRYALAFAQQEDLPVVILGGGNNLLVSDRGLLAVVVKLQGIFGRADFNGEGAAVGAGVMISELIREAAAHDLGGLEHLVGIPGTVGGAIVAGAGTHEGSIGDLCSAVYVLHPDGTLSEVKPMPQLGAGQSFELPPDVIVAGCRIRLTRRPAQKIEKDIQQRLKLRRAIQPFALASAGYVWKNPAAGLASQLIDSAGLRGKKVNGAEVCGKHSNLIVNRGGATHADVLALMDMTRDRVEARFGVTLQPNIRILGLPGAATREVEPLELAGAR